MLDCLTPEHVFQSLMKGGLSRFGRSGRFQEVEGDLRRFKEVWEVCEGGLGGLRKFTEVWEVQGYT